MEKTLTLPSKQRCADSQPTRESLIEEWVAKLAVNAGAALDAKTQAVYRSLWIEGLSDLPVGVLRAAFQKTLRECAYWPVKVADIRKHVAVAQGAATKEAAEKAWQMVLEVRRTRWSPDAPGGFYGGRPQLSERIWQACRASGVFRDVETVNDLHVWAKQRFLESFLAWDDSEAGKYMLPDGELKDLLTGFAKVKMLPWEKPRQDPKLLPEERLRVANELAEAARKVLEVSKRTEYVVKDTPERREELRYQAGFIKKSYPKKEAVTTT